MANNDKRIQVSRLLERLEREDSEDDEDGFEQFQPRFICPYCYEQYEITTLCVHLVDEHMHDPKPVLCPICANDVDNKDLVNHITSQHENVFGFRKIKRPRNLSIASRETQPLSQTRKDLQNTYLRALLQATTNGTGTGTSGTSGTSNNNNLSSEAAASLLSSLLADFPTLEGDQNAKKPVPVVEDLVRKPVPVMRSFKSRIDYSLSKEEKELRDKRSLVRASFTRDIIFSTIFGE